MYRVIITIGLLSFFSGLSAQDPINFNRVNGETYRLYMEEQWDSLIDLGKEALRLEIDYYYLRVRMGIAYYQIKKYRKATKHFTAALKFNEGDPLALEYLYYSRLFAGQNEEAKLVQKRFRGELATRLKDSKGSLIDRISVEYLYNKNLSEAQFSNPEELYTGLSPGIQYSSAQYSNASLSLYHNIVPGFSLAHAYTFLSKTNHYFYNDGVNQFQVADQHVLQHQYFLSPLISTRSGFQFTPVFHYIGLKYQTPLDVGQGFQGGTSQVTMGYLKESDFATGLGFKRGIGNVDLHLGAWYSSLNHTEQLQNRLGISWFPLGNLNLYAGGFINSQLETAPGSEGVLSIIPEILVGFSIRQKVWFDLNAVFGEMTNYLENNGAIVYNSFSEVMEKKVHLSISFPVTKKGSLLYLGSIWRSNRSEYYPFDPEQPNVVNTISYHTLSIYGGISWNL